MPLSVKTDPQIQGLHSMLSVLWKKDFSAFNQLCSSNTLGPDKHHLVSDLHGCLSIYHSFLDEEDIATPFSLIQQYFSAADCRYFWL